MPGSHNCWKKKIYNPKSQKYHHNYQLQPRPFKRVPKISNFFLDPKKVRQLWGQGGTWAWQRQLAAVLYWLGCLNSHIRCGLEWVLCWQGGLGQSTWQVTFYKTIHHFWLHLLFTISHVLCNCTVYHVYWLWSQRKKTAPTLKFKATTKLKICRERNRGEASTSSSSSHPYCRFFSFTFICISYIIYIFPPAGHLLSELRTTFYHPN